ncbi:hypothetical protein CFP65_4720 [Kitasatospora sp. MMS16-BH015]|uniref:vWA domain-containing protein n=1 Tax=Kitasatospora sp. MMS16-BH015 TaxID=2018025 RepID=UPI000CA3149B|nr:hypothetical protein [Kitasatospora sp. MMS16-BH015]AUG79446.1 hypothetical protein CFP65_4720 [Kitasatospora sp. MMS16-BH015]
MTETRGVLLPAYVVADESASMSPYQRELDEGVTSLCEGLRAEPMLAAKLRLAVLGFSEDVQVRLAVADMRTEYTVPRLQIRGVTTYGSVFDDLLHRLPADVRWLRSEGYRVHRPVVFFLSDGQPTDGDAWRASHAVLTDRLRTPAAPNIVACGIGDAQARTMVEVATRAEFAFLANPSADLGQAISEFFHALTASLVASSRALGSGDPTLVVHRPEHFTLVIDELTL